MLMPFGTRPNHNHNHDLDYKPDSNLNPDPNPDRCPDSNTGSNTDLYAWEGLSGNHQLQNASLALKLVHTYLQLNPPLETTVPKHLNPLPTKYIRGLENARWPGRCQSVQDPTYDRSTWFLDGAHTVESLACCGDWFVSPEVGLKTYVQFDRITQ